MTIMESSQQSTTCENEQKRSNTEDVSLITETAKLKLNDSNGSTQKINTTKKDSKNAKKSGKSGKLPKELITPEYIEKMRKEREEKKRLKREQLIAQGIDPDNINKTTYIKREMLEVPHSTETGKKSVLTFKIMTYNLLAQALIRRTLFPNNGDILKWQKRSKVLIQEIKDYACDILCLQEVDFVQYKTFWRPELG
jgi:RNA exonuclease NGL2